MNQMIDRHAAWAAIDTQRARVADLLGGLTGDEWSRPSLCEGWCVRDVAAHLTLQQLTWREAAALMIRYRGDVDRAIHEAARERAAALSPAEIVAAIRGTVGSRRHNAGATYRETLVDIVVHGLDIAVPLGRDLPIATDTALAVIHRVLAMRYPPPFPAAKAMKRYRLVATDADWSTGDGPEIRGPVLAILLAACGRRVALPGLAGPGVAALTPGLRP